MAVTLHTSYIAMKVMKINRSLENKMLKCINKITIFILQSEVQQISTTADNQQGDQQRPTRNERTSRPNNSKRTLLACSQRASWTSGSND